MTPIDTEITHFTPQSPTTTNTNLLNALTLNSDAPKSHFSDSLQQLLNGHSVETLFQLDLILLPHDLKELETYLAPKNAKSSADHLASQPLFKQYVDAVAGSAERIPEHSNDAQYATALLTRLRSYLLPAVKALRKSGTERLPRRAIPRGALLWDLRKSPKYFEEYFEMTPSVFDNLVKVLSEDEDLEPENLAVFLLFLSNKPHDVVSWLTGIKLDDTAEIFSQTCSKAAALSPQFVHPNEQGVPQRRLSRYTTLYACFKGCVGASGTTLIKHKRKDGTVGSVRFNIATTLDGGIQHIHPEPSVKDSGNAVPLSPVTADPMILQRDVNSRKFTIYEGEFILVDRGYPLTTKIIPPFEEPEPESIDENSDFLPDHFAKFTPHQKFNYVHKRLLAIVDTSCDILGSKFPLLRDINPFDESIQEEIIFATAVIYNFLLFSELSTVYRSKNRAAAQDAFNPWSRSSTPGPENRQAITDAIEQLSVEFDGEPILGEDAIVDAE